MSFRGTSVGQNTKFSNKEQKLLKSIKFPAVYAQPINVHAINMDAMRDWAAKRIFELLGVDDDIVTEMVFEYLAEDNLDPRRLHINLMPFLEANTTTFMKELWKLLVSASTSIGGIPREFIEARKRDILAAQGDQQRLIQDMDANAAAVQEHGYHALQPLSSLPPRPHHTPSRFDPADRSARDRYAPPQQQYPQQQASRWAAPHNDYDRSARDRAAPPPSALATAAPPRAPWSVAVCVTIAVPTPVPPAVLVVAVAIATPGKAFAVPVAVAAPPSAQQLSFAFTLAFSIVVAIISAAPSSPRQRIPVAISPPPRAQPFAIPLAVSLAGTQSQLFGRLPRAAKAACGSVPVHLVAFAEPGDAETASSAGSVNVVAVVEPGAAQTAAGSVCGEP
ncbi:hypothetical protein AMAG_06945 [Allomyces macrogynus ATCC 38327]|uniref:PWI domain-containing protein n=1 Tax=Allomyces macrogynus (strain ATCC 38327) TaxID=578462 RepID=A0A0L0SFP7_ALLM3|nr:hypothetical protein AMAG_06945 [Allomyces macrogynus ATCC 38327]|eukprot:KNE61195.1 hypothetical protein AMAG_06945 [Allomyces macrogynus ATCC 38327]